jgi:hypothetical protein
VHALYYISPATILLPRCRWVERPHPHRMCRTPHRGRSSRNARPSTDCRAQHCDESAGDGVTPAQRLCCAAPPPPTSALPCLVTRIQECRRPPTQSPSALLLFCAPGTRHAGSAPTHFMSWRCVRCCGLMLPADASVMRRSSKPRPALRRWSISCLFDPRHGRYVGGAGRPRAVSAQLTSQGFARQVLGGRRTATPQPNPAAMPSMIVACRARLPRNADAPSGLSAVAQTLPVQTRQMCTPMRSAAAHTDPATGRYCCSLLRSCGSDLCCRRGRAAQTDGSLC